MGSAPLIQVCCTRKLLEEIGRRPEALPDAVGDESSIWTANLIFIERRKCLLLTHHATLFTVFVPDLRRAQLRELEPLVSESLVEALALEGGAARSRISSSGIGLRRSRTRRVLGSMNDLAFQARVIIEAGGGLAVYDHEDLARRLNRIPMGALKYRFAIDGLESWCTLQRPVIRRNERITDVQEWVGGLYLAPFQVGKGAPYAPRLVIWLELPRNKIVWLDIQDPTEPFEFADSLLAAMAAPQEGLPRRPTQVRVADPQLASGLDKTCPGALIQVAPTPELDFVIEDMVQHLQRRR